MSTDSPATSRDNTSFLAEDEEEKITWQGILKEGEDNEYPAIFTATDQRLVFSLGSGHFKDIGLNHIESVEVAADKKTDIDGSHPENIIVLGVISAIAGISSMIIGGFSGAATLVGLVLLGIGGYAIWWGKENYDRLKDELEISEYTVYHIMLRTTAESPFAMPIYLETEENVGPELSKLVRESQ